MQAKLMTSFKRFSEAEFQTRVGLIISSLTGNARFPEPWPAPAVGSARLNDVFEAYRAAYNASVSRDVMRIGERQALREELTGMLQDLAPYLVFIAQGDDLALQSTGFELRHDPVPIDHSHPPTAPEGLRLQRGYASGDLDVRVTKVLGAASYEVQSTTGDPNDEANWHQALISATCSHMVLHHLTPLQTHWVRVRGIGTAGYGHWSTPSSIVVL
jgi:hypothetical protein